MKLISYSQDGEKSLEEIVCFCARVSNPTNQNNTETNSRLINYLIQHKHWSPFEMVSICLEIETTRDIARQILRHRSFSFQEFSQRYAEANMEFQYKPARLQDKKNRQNSIESDDAELEQLWEDKQSEVSKLIEETYTWAIENGIAKEQARAVLPEGMTLSRMYINGTLRSWIHYIQLRSGKETQKEHRDVAVACANAIKDVFPMIEQFIAT
jgi:thymidylate synthase (FAD)